MKKWQLVSMVSCCLGQFVLQLCISDWSLEKISTTQHSHPDQPWVFLARIICIIRSLTWSDHLSQSTTKHASVIVVKSNLSVSLGFDSSWQLNVTTDEYLQTYKDYNDKSNYNKLINISYKNWQSSPQFMWECRWVRQFLKRIWRWLMGRENKLFC